MDWKTIFRKNLEELINNSHYNLQPRHPKGSPEGGRWKSKDSTDVTKPLWEHKSKGELRLALMLSGIHSVSAGPEAMMAGIGSEVMGNQIGAHFTDMYDSRPELKGFVDKLVDGYENDKGIQVPSAELPSVFIKGDKEELGGGVIASYTPRSNQINMPGGIKSNPDELFVGQGQYNVGVGLEAAIRHEYGHYLALKVPNWIEWTDNVYDKITGNDTFKERVSGYAGTNYEEGWAESFTAWSHPNYKKSKNRLPKEVEDYFDNIFKKNPRRQI